MAMWIRSAMDTQAMAQFGDTQVPQPEHLFFDKASRRRRGEEIEAIPAEADTFDELFGEGKD